MCFTTIIKTEHYQIIFYNGCNISYSPQQCGHQLRHIFVNGGGFLYNVSHSGECLQCSVICVALICSLDDWLYWASCWWLVYLLSWSICSNLLPILLYCVLGLFYNWVVGTLYTSWIIIVWYIFCNIFSLSDKQKF